MALTKKKLSDLLSYKTGIRQADTKIVVDSFFSSINDNLAVGNSVRIKNFGKFSLKTKNERIGRNPKTKEPKIIKKRTLVSFKASSNMKAKIQIQGEINNN